MLFADRQEAGKLLVEPLKKYAGRKDIVVLGLPRGGVVLAYEVAAALKLPLDVTFPRKVGAPFNPELAIGAVTETGAGVFNEEIIEHLRVSVEFIEAASEREQKVAQKRLETYRKECPKINLLRKVVILVDDGLATGATMKAAILSVQGEGVSKVVVAVPVSPIDTFQEIEQLADEVIVLELPPIFYAVGQFYENFSATEDEEVVQLLTSSRHLRRQKES
jgi:putative phosphoribosyl transferase